MADNSDRLSSERAVRLLRTKAAELENRANILMQSNNVDERYSIGPLAADIALVASLLADHLEREIK